MKMTDEKPTLANRILHLPFLILAGLVIFVLFLIVAVAAGIVAAAYEFGNAFRAFFGHYFEVPIIAIILIALGIVLHLRKGKDSPRTDSKDTESSESQEQSGSTGTPVEQEVDNTRKDQEAKSGEPKKD